MAVAALPDTLIDELVAICGEDHVFTGRSALFNRARVPSPFPAHRWEELIPQAVVLPTSAEQISEVVKLANRHRVPVVPRAGATGLTDGAVPLKHGILVDVKLMNKILEIDVEDRTVTVQPGINMLKLSEELRPLGFIYPDNPASYPCSLVGGRIGTSGWSLIGGRFGHTRDLVISLRDRAPHRRDHPGRRRRWEEGAQVVLRLPAQAPLHGPPGNARDRHRGDARAGQAAGGGVLGVLRLSPTTWTRGRRRASSRARASRRSPASSSSTSGRSRTCVATTRRTSRSPTGSRPSSRSPLYGNDDEVRAGAKRILRIGEASGGTYLGDEISQGDWASRHDRYATPLHGRTPDGQVVPMSWHCEDASILYSKLPEVREKWHAIAAGLRERFDMFDDWGMFAYTNGAFKPWGDYLTEIDIGIWEMEWDDESWAAWVDAKREIARVAIESRRLDLRLPRLLPRGRGRPRAARAGRRLRVMKKIKRTLDPQQRHEPGQVPARPGLRGGGLGMIGFRLAAQKPPGGEAHHGRRSSCASTTSTRSTRRS